jgi:predicted GH43/DUF377 family glycosyl hydrolase
MNRKSLAFFLTMLLPLAGGSGGSSAQAGPAPRQPFQPWVKKGRLLAPGFAGPRSTKLVSMPSVVKLRNGRLRMYFWAGGEGERQPHQWRNPFNYIFAAEASPADPHRWELVKPEPVLEPASTGNMRDLGVVSPWVVRRDDAPWLLYYGCWGTWTPRDGRGARTGLAISHDEGITWEVIKEPLLPLGEPGEIDAVLTGSVCVLRVGRQHYRMWYTAGERFQSEGDMRSLIVHTGYATSRDGIQWDKSPTPALSPRLDKVEPFESVVSKPSILILDGVYHMWFSVHAMRRPGEPRGTTGYRLGYARSTDGIDWKRFADVEILPLTPKGFDSRHQSYPCVIQVDDDLWMFYTGDRYGATGIGLATLKKSDLIRTSQD